MIFAPVGAFLIFMRALFGGGKNNVPLVTPATSVHAVTPVIVTPITNEETGHPYRDNLPTKEMVPTIKKSSNGNVIAIVVIGIIIIVSLIAIDSEKSIVSNNAAVTPATYVAPKIALTNDVDFIPDPVQTPVFGKVDVDMGELIVTMPSPNQPFQKKYIESMGGATITFIQHEVTYGKKGNDGVYTALTGDITIPYGKVWDGSKVDLNAAINETLNTWINSDLTVKTTVISNDPIVVAGLRGRVVTGTWDTMSFKCMFLMAKTLPRVYGFVAMTPNRFYNVATEMFSSIRKK